ncbi:MAG: class I SAM-dependent methyltransferase [Actinomycetota bacterium]
MDGFDPATSFDGRVAAAYDDRPRGDEDACVDWLGRRAGGGRVLELAIGTGRIGLPLARAGHDVTGIEISADMIARLRAKDGGDALPVVRGDMADVAVNGEFDLVFVVYNTFFNLLTQDDQVRCFENVAAHLTSEGRFVIEAVVPWDLHRLRDNQYVDAELLTPGEARLDIARHDPVTQILDENHVSLTEDGLTITPIVTRYAWPSELDLMARLTGLRLVERVGGWRDEPFDAHSRRAVSVYGR